MAPPLATTLPVLAAVGLAEAFAAPKVGFLAAAAFVGTGLPVAAAFFSAPMAPPIFRIKRVGGVIGESVWVRWGGNQAARACVQFKAYRR